MKILVILMALSLSTQYFNAQKPMYQSLPNYESNFKTSTTFNKSIQVNDVIVDEALFFDHHLTNTKLRSIFFWTANSEEDIKSLSKTIRNNISDSGIFSKKANYSSNTDFLFNTHLLFWNSSSAYGKGYMNFCAIVELQSMDSIVIWNKKYYYEVKSMIWKRRPILKLFIDQLLEDLASLELNDKNFKLVNLNPLEDLASLELDEYFKQVNFNPTDFTVLFVPVLEYGGGRKKDKIRRLEAEEKELLVQVFGADDKPLQAELQRIYYRSKFGGYFLYFLGTQLVTLDCAPNFTYEGNSLPKLKFNFNQLPFDNEYNLVADPNYNYDEYFLKFHPDTIDNHKWESLSLEDSLKSKGWTYKNRYYYLLTSSAYERNLNFYDFWQYKYFVLFD